MTCSSIDAKERNFNKETLDSFLTASSRSYTSSLMKRRFCPDMIIMAELHNVLKCSKPSVIVVDVFTPQEYAAGHVPKSFNIPIEEEIGHIEELVKR